MDAFERYDIERLVELLHEDAVQSMPPFAMWLQGAAAIGAFMVQPGPSGCRGSRLVATSANGCPAFGQYRLDPAGGYAPWALQGIEISGGRIAEMSFFLALLDPERLFPDFGLPLHLDPRWPARPSSSRSATQTSLRVTPPPRRPARSTRLATWSTAPMSGGPGPSSTRLASTAPSGPRMVARHQSPSEAMT